MRAIHKVPTLFLLAATLLLAPAGRAAAKPLDELDRRIAAYEVSLTGEPAEDEQRIVAATDELEQIVELAESLDDKHLARGMLRALEAYLILADALLVAPCPETLGPETCAIYRSMLAERAAILARTAMAMATSLHSSGEVRGADRKRFEDLTQRGASTVAQAVMMIIEAPVAAPARFALVWGNAELYTTPDASTPLRAFDYDDGARLESPDAVYLVQVVGDVEAGGLVEVLLGGGVEWDQHCAGSNLMPPWVEIRAWVDPADMVPVLAEEARVEHDDGTGVHLMPGTPRVGEQAWLAGQLVPIPADATWATTYTGDVARLEGRTISAHFDWDVSGAIGGEPFAVRQPGTQYGDNYYIDGWAADDTGGLVTQKHRCGEVRFRVGSDVVPGEETAEGLGVFGMEAQGEWITISAGSALYWSDGSDAGVVARDHSVRADEVTGEAMRCVEVEIAFGLRGMTANSVSVCAQAGDWVSP